MKKYRRYLALLLLLGGALSVTFLLAFSNDENANDYVNVIPETLNVQEGDVFDLAIDSNLDLSALNIVSSNLSTVRLEGRQLKALSGGTAFITVQSQDGRVQDQVLITVNPLVTGEPVEELSFEIIVGDDQFTFREPITISQLDAPLREGFTFIGFSLEENGEVLESDAVIDESLTLYSIYQATEEETLEPPVVDDEDTEDEDESDEDPEEPDDEPNISTPSSITVTLESDQGITMSVLIISPGSLISVEDFDTDLSEVGYFIKGETCENPFDFDTPLVTDTSIVFGEMNYTSPCIELDEMATLGNLQVGETIEAFVSPSAATITYEWFISDNDRDYSLLRNVTGSTLELLPEHFRQYIAVKLTGTGDYIGSLSLPLGRVGLSRQTIGSGGSDGSGDSGDSEGSSDNSNIIEIYDWDDFSKIGENSFKEFILMNNLNEFSNGYAEFVSGGRIRLENSTLNGNYKTIDGFTSAQGLFSQTNNSTIMNLGITNISISGIDNTSLFGGNPINTTLSQIFVTGEISSAGGNGEPSTGGLYQYLDNRSSFTMIDSFLRLKITSEHPNVGVLFARTTGDGGNPAHTVVLDNVYSASEVITTGSVNADDFNSIFGVISTDPLIEFDISGSGVFYDSDLDTSASPTGNAITGNITGLPTVSMKDINTYINAGFDIGNENSNWAINSTQNEGYPYLKKRVSEFISDGFIPIASVDDLLAINSESSHSFANGISGVTLVTEGGLNKNYFLVRDIDLSSIGITDKAIIAPNFGDSFEGIFDGNDYTLSNLNISLSAFGSYGLFGTVTGDTTIQNLSLENFISIKESSANSAYIGLLVGQLDGGQLELINLRILSGNISSNGNFPYVGGFIGYANGNVTISNIINKASISGHSNVGGMIGYFSSTNNINILNSINLGNVTGSGKNIGGFIGSSDASGVTIKNSFNLGMIEGNSNVGGIIGIIGNTDITVQVTMSGVYSAESITGNTNIGQITGQIPSGNILIIGEDEVIYNTTISVSPVGLGDSNVTGIFTALSETGLKDSNIFPLEGIWVIENGKNSNFPYLQWASDYIPSTAIIGPEA